MLSDTSSDTNYGEISLRGYNLDLPSTLTPSDRLLLYFWTDPFDTLRPSTFILLDRLLWHPQTVHFDTLRPSTLTTSGRPLWYLRTVHFDTLRPSTLMLLDRPLRHFDSSEGPSTFSRMTVYFDPWPSTLAQKTVHYRPGPSSLAQMTVQFGSRPSTFGRTVHFRATVHFKDRPLSPFRTVHFGPDSKSWLHTVSAFDTDCVIWWIWRKVMFPPGLEPGTFRVLGERDNHYTTETCFKSLFPSYTLLSQTNRFYYPLSVIRTVHFIGWSSSPWAMDRPLSTASLSPKNTNKIRFLYLLF